MCCGNGGGDKAGGRCDWCGGELPSSTPRRGRPQKYCSEDCRKDGRKWRGRDDCLRCGGAVKARQTFCSSQCREAWKAEPRRCIGCGGDVYQGASLRPRIWCSRTCYQVRRKRERSEARRATDIRRCDICEQRLPAKRWPERGRYKSRCERCRRERGICRDRERRASARKFPRCLRCARDIRHMRNARYCSPECRFPAAACAECGQSFRSKHRVAQFCSRKCAARHQGPLRAKLPVLNCLCCNKPFRQRTGGGRVGKYCSRRCAYEARYLRLPHTRFTSRRGTALHCQLAGWFHSWGNDADDALPIRHQRGGHKFRCLKYGVPYEPISAKAVFADAEWRCELCGVALLERMTEDANGKVDRRSPTIDHIIPLSMGPPCPGHVRSNVQAACWGCNMKKGAKMPAPPCPDSFAATAGHRLP